ncbi:MAG: hypothetical protein RQ966_02180 [Acetobacteraceae bacterium]|nr:hypothetical protein [Acetobacteraceae bacterium]
MDHASPRDSTAPLAAFAAGTDGLPLALLSLQPGLLSAVQDRLAHHGLLDPPADRFLGPVTTWAISQFARATGEPSGPGLFTPVLARRLLEPDPVLPLDCSFPDFASRVVRAMQGRGDWLCRHPDALTIAYVEHTEPDGTPSRAREDAFDDVRLLLRIRPAGRPAIVGCWEATTRSGRDATDDPVDEQGPPILDPGQYKARVMGRTAIGTKLEQDALVQCLPLPVIRDADKDSTRHGDPADHGFFVIDQHGSFDAPRDEVGGTSAGCLVGKSQAGHVAFIGALRTDPRFRANNAYRFMTSLLTPRDCAGV